MLNHYNREHMAQTHCQDLLREAEYERLIEQLPRPRRGFLRFDHIPLRIKLSWKALCMRLRQAL